MKNEVIVSIAAREVEKRNWLLKKVTKIEIYEAAISRDDVLTYIINQDMDTNEYIKLFPRNAAGLFKKFYKRFGFKSGAKMSTVIRKVKILVGIHQDTIKKTIQNLLERSPAVYISCEPGQKGAIESVIGKQITEVFVNINFGTRNMTCSDKCIAIKNFIS